MSTEPDFAAMGAEAVMDICRSIRNGKDALAIAEAIIRQVYAAGQRQMRQQCDVEVCAVDWDCAAQLSERIRALPIIGDAT